MKKTSSKKNLSLATRLLFTGANAALLAAAAPALANNGHGGAWQSTMIGAHTAGSGGVASGSFVPAHFGATNLVHPHASALAGSFALAGPASITMPNFHIVMPSAVTLANQAINLDLSSAQNSIVLPTSIVSSGSAVTISVGGHDKSFQGGDRVTPAEYVAISQALGGGQAITIDSHGRADGGSFSLNSLLAGGSVTVGGLTIPKNVTALDYINGTSNVSLSGKLLNYGSIEDITKSGTAAANLSALNIVNEKSGLITSLGNGGGIVDLTLSASNNFSNMGTISGSGNLTINAGGSITNGGIVNGSTAGGAQSGQAVISAAKDVTLQAPVIQNTGVVTSLGGNINLGAASNQTLAISAGGGTFSAQNGAINVRGTSYDGTADTTVTGGNFLSQQVSLNAGGGILDFNADQVTGVVSSSGNAVHVSASTDNLILGSQTLTGDPTYFNDSGSILITGPITAAESIAIVAQQDITASTTAVTQITSTNGTVTLLAGADIQVLSGTKSSNIPPGTTGSITVDGASTQGGNIDLSGAASSLVISATKGVTLAAFQQTASNGNVLLPASSKVVGNNSAGINGDVTVIAGSLAPTAIRLNEVDGTNVNIIAAPPVLSTGKLTFNSTGDIVSGSLSANFSFRNGGIDMTGGKIVSAQTAEVIGGANIVMPVSIAANNVVIATNGNIAMSGGISTTHSIVMAAGGDITDTTKSTVTSTLGGNVVMAAGAAFSINNTGLSIDQLLVAASSGTGGSINLGKDLVSTTNTGGAAGNIVLAAFSGGANGNIPTPSLTTGAPGISSGNIEITAGGPSAITTANPIFFSGTAGTGSLTLLAAAPNASTPVNLLSANPSFAGSSLSGTANVITFSSGIIANGANVTIQQPGLLSTPSFVSQPTNFTAVTNAGINLNTLTITGSLVLSTAGDITLGASDSAANMLLLAGGNVINAGSTTLQAPKGLWMVAGTDIKGTGFFVINTGASSGPVAGDLHMIAGADFQFANGQVTINGPSFFGGNIDLSAAGPVGLSASGFSPTTSGGNITLAAFNENGNGNVLLPNTSNVVSTSGGASTVAGDVAIISGSSGPGITLSMINGRNITATISQPVILNGPLTLDTSGAITSGALSANMGARNTGNISFLGSSSMSATGIATFITGGTVTMPAGVTAGQILAAADGGIILNGSLTTQQGVVLVSAGNITTTSGVFGTISAQQSTDVVLVAGAQFFTDSTGLTLNQITVQQASNNGGNIDFTGAGYALSTFNGTPNYNAGNVVVAAFASVSNPSASGFINLVSGGAQASGTSVGGKNGNIELTAGALAPNSVVATGPFNTNGGGSTTTGNITILNIQPNVGASGETLIGATPTFVGGSLAAGTQGSMNLSGSFALGGGNLTIMQPASLTMPIPNAGTTGTYTAQSNGDLTIPSIVSNVGSLVAIAGGNINANAPLLSTTTTLLANGNVTFTTPTGITSPGGILVVAGGNISASVANVSFNTSGAKQAGALTMVSGASFTVQGNQVQIGSNGPGGGIDLSGGSTAGPITAASPSGISGDINFIAFFGNINIPGPNINDNGAKGNVTFIASAQGANTIAIGGGISSTNANGGDIYIATTQPGAAVLNFNGTRASGDFRGGSIEAGGGGLTIGPVTMGGHGNFTLIQDQQLTVSSTVPTLTAANLITLQSNSLITVDVPLNGNALQCLTIGSINLSTNLQYAGGITLVAGGDITAPSASIVSTATTGNAGQINIIAGAQFSYDGTNVSITGATGNGGIGLGLATVFSSQSSGGRGGDITLVAGSFVAINTSTNITTSGAPGFANGSLTAVGGLATGTAVDLGVIDLSNGAVNPGSGSVALQSGTPNLSNVAPLVITGGLVTSGNPVNPLGNASTSANIIASDVTARGGSITVLSSKDVTLGNLDTSAPIGSVLAGGNITVTTNGSVALQVGGTPSANFVQSISFGGDNNFNGNLTLTNLDAGSKGNGGLSLQSPLSFTAGHGGNITLTAGSASGDNINLGTNNTFDLSDANSSGSLGLFGNHINWTGTLLVDVHGINGTAGAITFAQAGTTALTVDKTLPVSFNASGAQDQTAGSITITNGGNLTLDPTSSVLNVSANASGGSAGALDLEAGWFQGASINNANLLLLGPINLSGVGANGQGGALTLFSNSTTAFNIGLTSKNTNGVMGSITLGGTAGFGQLNVENASGDVTNSVALTQAGIINFTAGGAGNVVIGAPLGTAVSLNNVNAPNTNSMTLSTLGTGTIIQTKSTDLLSAGQIHLTNNSGDIGGKAAIFVNAPTIFVNSAGNANINDSALTVLVSQGNAGATNTFTIVAANKLATQAINAGSISLKANDILYNGSLSGSKTGTISLTALTGDITDNAADDISTGGAVTLSALKGDVFGGSFGQGLFAPSSITITALNHAVTSDITSTGNVTIKQTSTITSGVAAVNGDLTVTNPAAVIAITGNGVAGVTRVTGDINGGKSVTLTSTNGFLDVGGVGNITAPQLLTMTAASGVNANGNVTAVNAVTIKTTSSSNASGIAEVHLNGNVLVTSSSGTITVTSTGIADAISTDNLDAQKSISLTATRGEVDAGSIGSTSKPSSVSLTAFGFINTADITAVKTIAIKTTGKLFPDGDIFMGGDITATDAKGTITVTSSSQVTGIGSSGNVNASTVTLSAAKAGIQVDNINSTGKVSLTAANVVEIDGTVMGGSAVTVAATASNGAILLDGLITGGDSVTPNVGTITLTAGGNISSTAASDIVAGKSISITSKGGDVSLSFVGSGPVVRPQTITIKAFDNLTLGDVESIGNISASTTGKVVGSSVEIDGPFTTQQGAISVISSGSALNVNGDLTAQSTTSAKATILLQDSNKAGSITLSNATIQTGGTGGGDINIAVGAPGKNSNITNPNPATINVSGNAGKNQVYWGTPGVVDPTSDGNFTIKGASVIFSGTQANSIFFTNVNVTADPVIQPTVETTHASASGMPGAAPNVIMPAINSQNVTMPTLSILPVSSVTPVAILQVAPITASNATAISGLTSAAANGPQILQGKAEYFTPALRMISETEMDGGEVPVALLRGDMEIDSSAASQWCTLQGQAAEGAGSRVAHLDRGAVLAMPDHDTTLRTNHGDISISGKSVVLVVSTHAGVAIYNLDDRKAGAVTIQTGGVRMAIRPGTSALIATEEAGSYEQINPVRLVCHRGMHEQKLGGGKKAFCSEFSLPSAFAAVRPLRQLLSSPVKADRDMANHLLKTTSILMQLQGGGQPFTQMLPAQMTAFANH